jgi:hypothetical protein
MNTIRFKNRVVTIVSILFLSAPVCAAGDEGDGAEYFFPSISKYLSGFGYGPLFKFEKVGDKILGGSGGGGGLLLFRRVVLAYYGHGTVDKVKLDDDRWMAFIQNGGIAGYRIIASRRIHPFVFSYVGSGELTFSDDDGMTVGKISFLSVEPVANCEVNLARGMTMAAGLGYKLSFGNDESFLGCTRKDSDGLTFCITFFFGDI